MAKYKIIFKGDDYVVLKLGKDVTVQSLIHDGFLIQKDGSLFTKDGKKVIISESDFFRIDPKLVGRCGGSVFEIFNGMVMSNWHVMECVDKLDFDGDVYPLDKSGSNYVEMKPLILPAWMWELMEFFGIDFYSTYDFAMAQVNGNVQAFNTSLPRPRAVYTAGNCLSKDQRGCLGIALPVPFEGEPDYIRVLKGLTVVVDCTYWGYKTDGKALDVGTVFINYGDGYARFKHALLIQFPSTPGIPGCSGSMVYPLVFP